MRNLWAGYELLDFGEGRKLERFGPWTLDRPCPAAQAAKGAPRAWREATACFLGDRAADGEWSPAPDRWTTPTTSILIDLGAGRSFRLELEPLPSGQIGVFPEQLANWRWIAARVAAQGPPLNVLNLFAYTGGITLAAAAAGAAVVHVDAARSVVARARQNAAASGLADRPIRWIAEDATKFCRREARRGNRYDAVILDPPTYGHGPQGDPWSIRRDLLPLLDLCGELTERRP